MLLHRFDQPQQLGERTEHIGGYVVDRSLQIRPDGDEELEVGHAWLCPGEERTRADLPLDRGAPLLQIPRRRFLPGPLLLRLVLDADDWPHPRPQILDRA